jgi:hypothetical protein
VLLRRSEGGGGNLAMDPPEGVVPEASSNDESAVHSSHEAAAGHPHLLTEVVTQMAPSLFRGYSSKNTDRVVGTRQ